MIKPKQIKCKTIDGEELEYTISRIPAVYAREIITQYPSSAMPKVGDYKVNQDLMVKLLGYVSVNKDGHDIKLGNIDLINNHVPDFDVLAKIEYEMLNYNSNFFSVGKISKGLSGLAESLKPLITQILKDSQVPLSQKAKLAWQNLGKSTTSKTR